MVPILLLASLSCVPEKRELQGLECDVFDQCLERFACVNNRCVLVDELGRDAQTSSDAAHADQGLPPDVPTASDAWVRDQSVDLDHARRGDSSVPDRSERSDSLALPDSNAIADQRARDLIDRDLVVFDAAAAIDAGPRDSQTRDSALADVDRSEASSVDSAHLDASTSPELPEPVVAVNFEDCSGGQCSSLFGADRIASMDGSGGITTGSGYRAQGAVLNYMGLTFEPSVTIQNLQRGSIDFWVHIDNASSTLLEILDSNTGRRLRISATSGVIQIDARETLPSLSDGGPLRVSTFLHGMSMLQTQLGDGSWHHFSYSSGNAGHVILIDAVPVDMEYSIGGSDDQVFVAWAGLRPKIYLADQLVGGVDDIRVYAKALGPVLVRQEMATVY